MFIVLAALVLLVGLGAGLSRAGARVAGQPVAFLLGVVALTVVLLVAAWLCGLLARRIPKRVVLVLDLTQPLSDHGGDDLLGALSTRGRLSLRHTVEALERASSDPRVAGLVAWIRTPAKGLAGVQELRDAIAGFRAAGKFAVAHAETFGEQTTGNGAYYLATACDEIWLQPSGDVGLVGLAMEVNFLRGALDKLGVVPQLEHRHEYKSYKNRFTETGFTPAHREASARIVESLFDQLVAGVAEGRQLDPSTVRALIDRAPIFGGEAVEVGLADRLGYRDEVIDEVKARTDGATLLSSAVYAARTRRRRRRSCVVALIQGTGTIVQGHSRPDPLTRNAMGSDTITVAFRRAVEDKRVKAILFRIDSPGGSYVASDTIWRETVRAREAGKPVIVSMADVAASGGYFVAMEAERIVAHPATITGSIGVIAGKPVIAGLKRKVGIATDEVHLGANALMASTSTPYTPHEWEWLQGSLDRVYDDFTSKVAAGRGLDIEQVHEVAKGRVWTGADARSIGLVDELGGYPAALRAVRDALGLPADAPLRLTPFPLRRSVLARALGRDGHTKWTYQMEETLAPLLDVVRQATSQHGVLEMPDLPIRW